jgi:hypothetical protein
VQLLVHPVNKEVMMNEHELAFHPDGEQKFLTAELTGCTNYGLLQCNSGYSNVGSCAIMGFYKINEVISSFVGSRAIYCDGDHINGAGKQVAREFASAIMEFYEESEVIFLWVVAQFIAPGQPP